MSEGRCEIFTELYYTLAVWILRAYLPNKQFYHAGFPCSSASDLALMVPGAHSIGLQV